MKLIAVFLLFFSFAGHLRAAIEPVYEGANGIRNGALAVCMQCHSTTLSGAARGGAPSPPNFDTYQEAIQQADNAVARAVGGTMPPAGFAKLSAEQKGALLDWQAAGFPQRSAAPAADTQAPTTPGGLSATAAGTSAISLSWASSTDNVAVTSYKVFRGGVLIATLGNVTGHSDTGLSAATTFTYTVVACDAAGNCSTSSAAALASTQQAADTQAPSTPLGVVTTVVSAGEIVVSWNASSDNVAVTGYQVFRGTTLVTTLGTLTSYSDSGLSAATTYGYTIAACDAAGNCSAPSTPVSATTLQAVVVNPNQLQDCFFNYAETNFPTVFVPRATSQSLPPYYYRFYPPGTFLAIAGDKLLYLGPLSSNNVVDLGDIGAWYRTAGCN